MARRPGAISRRAGLAVAVVVTAMLSPRATVATGLTQGKHALQACEFAAAYGLGACFATASARLRTCYLRTGEVCAPDDAPLTRALANLARRVRNACPSDATVQALGYGPHFTVAALTTRVQTECLGAAQTLAARSFGGPQAAVLDAAPTGGTRTCLNAAYRQAALSLRSAFGRQSRCIRAEHRGAAACDRTLLAEKLVGLQAAAISRIGRACPATSLDDAIGLDEHRFTDRALEQARCMVATAHGDVGSLALDCGPRPGVPALARGQWTQIVLDSSTSGTLCGKGGPYAFWVRLAPSGANPAQVVVHLAGGGVCLFQADCAGVIPSLFEALSYTPPGSGIMSTSATTNPFSDWTMVALPYCTQDVYIGGGVGSVFADGSVVHRYGAVNLRAALRYVRDLLWTDLAATSATGYRPDLMQVLFVGESAGGFGVEYNYHYLLDDLRWAHTTAVPDSALALDNGTALSVRTLGALFRQDPPNGWLARAFQPPYCASGACAVGPVLEAATAARLKAVPDQQLLNVSNQEDDSQRATTFFSTMPSWTTAVRQGYCATQGLTGIRYWLPANPTPLHTALTTPDRWDGTTLSSEGVSLRDWLAGAIASPDGVVDLVEEGTLASTLGVSPFACPVGP